MADLPAAFTAFLILVGAMILLLTAALAFYIFTAGPKLSAETEAIIDRVVQNDPPELVRGQTGVAATNGVDIWYEHIAPPGASRGVVLLLLGQGGDALGWPPAFVAAFVAAGYQIVRYDHRGTGQSDWLASWTRRDPYTLTDMAADGVSVLDALAVPAAHLVGLSMGGMIAQEIAAAYPDRVLSLTLMSTSGYIGDPELPTLTTGALARFVWRGLPLLRYRLLGGEKNLIRERIAKMMAYGVAEIDAQETAERVLYDLRRRRGINLKGVRQHQAAITISGSRHEKLRGVKAPALVIHGEADWLIPIEHGRKLTEQLPHARGLWLAGVGHTFPYPDMTAVNREILRHIEQSQQQEV